MSALRWLPALALCLLLSLVLAPAVPVSAAASRLPWSALASALGRNPSSPSPIDVQNCHVTQSWSVDLPANKLAPIYFAPNACQAIVLLDGGSGKQSALAGVDMTSGAVVWSVPFVAPYVFDMVESIVASPSIAHRVYHLSQPSQSGCRGVSAATYDLAKGLSPVWNTTICGNTQMPILIPLSFSSPKGEVVLVVEFVWGQSLPAQWTTLDGATGAVLHQDSAMPSSGEPVRVLGGPDGDRVFVDTDLTALSYQLDASGQWTLVANVSTAAYIVAGQPWGTPAYAPRILALQQANTTALDIWVGVDMATGKQVWSVTGEPIFTGAWAASLPSVTVYDPYMQFNPLHPNYIFVSAAAFNTSITVFQWALLDTRTGHITAQSPICTSAGGTGQTAWVHAVDELTLVVREVQSGSGARDVERWWALDAMTLKLVSSGQYTTPGDYAWDNMGFVAADKDSAAVWWTSGGQFNGTVYKADKTSGARKSFSLYELA